MSKVNWVIWYNLSLIFNIQINLFSLKIMTRIPYFASLSTIFSRIVYSLNLDKNEQQKQILIAFSVVIKDFKNGRPINLNIMDFNAVWLVIFNEFFTDNFN